MEQSPAREDYRPGGHQAQARHLSSIALHVSLLAPKYYKEMKIAELKPSEQVKWICITGVDEWIGSTVSFKLQPGDKETLLNFHPEVKDQIQQQKNLKVTLLNFHHDGWKEYTPMFAECNYTWGQFLRSLKLLCETGEGRPWPNQHRTEP